MKEVDIVRQTIVQFCTEFVKDPYLCYTEHGQHALFYAMLYNNLPEEQRFTTWQGRRVCVIQKEYPTACRLGKPRRQHWDVAILQVPPQTAVEKPNAYDYLRLAAAVELGMNVAREHLVDDIERLCHPKAGVVQGFIVHLYRLSTAGALFSSRDWSSNSKRILTREDVGQLSIGKAVEIFYAMHDKTCRYETGAWVARQGRISPLKRDML